MTQRLRATRSAAGSEGREPLTARRYFCSFAPSVGQRGEDPI